MRSGRGVGRGAAGVDGGRHGAVEVVGADGLDQTDEVQVSPKLQGCPGDVDLDVPLAQAVDHLPQRRLALASMALMNEPSRTTCRTGLGAPSTAAQSRRLKKWAFAKNNRSWMR